MNNKHCISLLFLFAIIMVLAHGIIPHQHYDKSFRIKIYSDCKTSEDHHGKSAREPWYCQPYSQVVFIEHKLLNGINRLIPDKPDFQAEALINALTRSESEVTNILLPNHPVLHVPLPSLPLLRAPPASDLSPASVI